MITQEEYWTSLTTAMTDKVIGDEYLLLEELGRGSYGCLFLGQSIQQHTYVAVKILSKAGLDHQQRQIQQMEADIQSMLHHPNILALHRVLQDDDYIYMVMELCDQGDMFDFVVRDQQEGGLRDEEFVKTAFLQILDAMEYMHAHNVYHRDIKLENILLKSDDEEEIVCKVADFGLATCERFSMEFGCGSSTYLAPEHFDDDQADVMRADDGELLPYDAAASDVWSLGVLLLALLFGRNPWQEATSLDAAFAEFQRDPTMLKNTLFPTLSWPCFRLLTSVLSIHPADRPTVKQMKKQFMALDRLVVSEAEQDAVFVEEEPVDIPCPWKKTERPSYDSAVFSAVTGASWSDLVEEDLQKNHHYNGAFDHGSVGASSTSQASYALDEDDDTDMFIHSQEKESWWL